LGESNDITDTAQLVIFNGGVDESLNVTEELLDLVPLHDITTGVNLLEAVEGTFVRFDLKWEKLASVATDGAPAMTGRLNGLIGLFRKKLQRLCLNFIHVHCLSHQESLCAKSIQMQEVLGPVMKIVNFIKANGKTHRQLQECLSDIQCEFGNLPYLTEVRFLSRGNVLTRFYDLLDVIQWFLDMKRESFPKLYDDNWIADLAFSPIWLST